MVDLCLLGCGGNMPMPYRNLSATLLNFKGRKILIDCGEGTQVSMRMIGWGVKSIDVICITHCHGDHIGGGTELKQACGGKILIHRDDSEGLNDKYINLSGVIDIPEITLEADSRVDDGDLIHLGDLEFRVIHTPGHTKGGSSLYCETEKCLFSGDTMFSGTWGRTDLPTSNREDIMKSITEQLLKLPDETIVYPGHGKPTRIGDEKIIYLELKPKQ